MKVLHINSYYSTSKFYKNLYDNQVKDGLDISVFVPVSTSYKDDNFDYGDYAKVTINHGKYDRFIFHLKQAKILKDVEEEYNIKDYSLLHSHSLFANGYISYKLNKKYGIPYVVAVRDTDLNVFFKKRKLLWQTGIQILKNAKKIVLLSYPYKKQLLKKYIPKNLKQELEDKIEIIPNGIDSFWLDNKPNISMQAMGKTIKILQVGVISKRKNQRMTVAAVKALREQGYNVEVTFVGRINDKDIFTEITRNSFVNYLEPLSKEGLIEIYRSHDIFIMPSITETFGLVYAEAMSQGLPVLYSKNQGFDGQFLDGEAGYSVDSFDVENIKEKLIQVIEEYEHISIGNIQRCKKFDWVDINKRYEELYKQMI
ncbi:hypothetical protein ACA30_04000 [Virgibacillus soli]|nr:hypothetical protein ACA30_04000 [Virgibacillus soli]